MASWRTFGSRLTFLIRQKNNGFLNIHRGICSTGISLNRHVTAEATLSNSLNCHSLSTSSFPTCIGSLVRQTRNYSKGKRQVEVSFEELTALTSSGDIQLIDVREPNELEEYGRIPGAVNIPLDRVHEALQLPEHKFESLYGVKKPSEDDENIVFSCLGGVRSYHAVLQAIDAGFLKARHYRGGWEEYSQRTGQPLKKSATS